LTKLKNKELVDDEGLILVNKNREAGAVREIIRHEDAHDLIQGNDPTGETRQEVADSLNNKTKERIDQHLKGRSDYSQLNDVQKMEEYSADVLANRVKDDDFKQTLSNSGLLSKTISKKEQVISPKAVASPVVVDLKDIKIEPQIKEAIKKSPEMQQTITKINQNTSQPGFFSNDLQFKMFRKDFRQVAEQIGRLSKTLNFNFGKLGKQIVNLDKVLPNEDASSIEIKAATQEAGINENDLKDFLQDINT
ncbi:hypothetical protein KKC16_00780, partial [Patescibacteria group bacterium]|nr:hypothetical protein [Patescibacteria group bacterium]